MPQYVLLTLHIFFLMSSMDKVMLAVGKTAGDSSIDSEGDRR